VNAPPLLVALDLDGTLIDDSLVLRPRVREAVAAVRAAGIATTIVTGRMFVATRPFARELGIAGAVGCYQGAAVYDVESGDRLSETPLKHDIAMRVVDRAKRDGHFAQLYHDDRFYVEEYTKYAELYARLAGVQPVVVPSLAVEFAGRDSTKCNIVMDAESVERYIKTVREVCGEDAYVTRSNPEFIEVMDPHVDKAVALRFIAQRAGVPMERVFAIGDSYNDIPMLQAVGFGVAMGSSPQELKAQAKAVVSDYAHDGVAEALETYVLGPARAQKFAAP
jgi:Cof subfamily protein (haloacid dehalogenase superfamily)